MFDSRPKIDAETDEEGCGLLLIALIGMAVAIFLLLGAWEELVDVLMP